jgi:hypothetical protein
MLKAAGFAVVASTFVIALVVTHSVKAADKNPPPATMPVPADYREWVYLTSGLDMTYTEPNAGAKPDDNHTFDNVFVNPEAYKVFKQTGTWPDKTVLVLENRAGEGAVSINKGGKTQAHDVSGLEIHAKINNEWAFYVRGGDGNEHLLPKPASCYTCHEAHAAVDTTFTQFYPTLLPIAKEKKVLSAAYVAEEAAKSAAK